MKKKWIYQIRALAILAVVVCHQQSVLHNTEVVQAITLYSVTTLIFLMGLTKSYSLINARMKKYNSIWQYSGKSICAVLMSYAVASFFYTYQELGYIDNDVYVNHLINFSACGPFYFVKYYILLSLWAPLIYSSIKKAYEISENIFTRIFLLIGVYLAFWLIGYISTGNIDIFGSSYLFVYALGMGIGILGQDNFIKINNKVFAVIAVFTLLFGGISTKRFYWARVAGNRNYSEGIDFLCPKLQMNPPNLSIILYSLGVIMVSYLMFIYLNKYNNNVVMRVANTFVLIGKNSIDIFLWHIFIQSILNKMCGGGR